MEGDGGDGGGVMGICAGSGFDSHGLARGVIAIGAGHERDACERNKAMEGYQQFECSTCDDMCMMTRPCAYRRNVARGCVTHALAHSPRALPRFDIDAEFQGGGDKTCFQEATVCECEHAVSEPATGAAKLAGRHVATKAKGLL